MRSPTPNASAGSPRLSLPRSSRMASPTPPKLSTRVSTARAARTLFHGPADRILPRWSRVSSPPLPLHSPLRAHFEYEWSPEASPWTPRIFRKGTLPGNPNNTTCTKCCEGVSRIPKSGGSARSPCRAQHARLRPGTARYGFQRGRLLARGGGASGRAAAHPVGECG
jgi:hypothetical protein